MPHIPRRTRCRACNTFLMPVLSLGPINLSDFPRSAETPPAHPPVPLDLMRCPSEACGMVQLAHTTPPDWLFKTYWYRSGVNETMVAELQDIVRQAISRVSLPPELGPVVDIGANDGTLLAQYLLVAPNARLFTVAYEPAANLYEALRPRAKVLFPEYFHADASWSMFDRARIVTAVAMFYDLEDPHAFLDSITRILHPKGLFIVQQAYLPAMLQATAFDNICHEHLAYHDLHSMEALLEPHGLEVVDVEERSINGGSFRTYIQFQGVTMPTPAVANMRGKERVFFHDRSLIYETFADRVEEVRVQLQGILSAYHHSGGVVDLLGASTKGNTLLQFCGIDHTLIRQAWERSPEKHGRVYGVSGIPIVSEEVGRADRPAALLSTIWQFKEAILQREHAYLSQGGRIILPLPAVESVEHAR
jgi:SAM-dependent methyltransferase